MGPTTRWSCGCHAGSLLCQPGWSGSGMGTPSPSCKLRMGTEGVGATDGATVRKYTTLDPVELSEETELSEFAGENEPSEETLPEMADRSLEFVSDLSPSSVSESEGSESS